jgi:hypothetical protein
MVLSRAQAKDVFNHVLDNVLELDHSSPLKQALIGEGIEDIFALLSMDACTIDCLTYSEICTTSELSKGDKLLLNTFHNYMLSKTSCGENAINASFWKSITKEDFDEYLSSLPSFIRDNLPGPSFDPPVSVVSPCKPKMKSPHPHEIKPEKIVSGEPTVQNGEPTIQNGEPVVENLAKSKALYAVPQTKGSKAASHDVQQQEIPEYIPGKLDGLKNEPVIDGELFHEGMCADLSGGEDESSLDTSIPNIGARQYTTHVDGESKSDQIQVFDAEDLVGHIFTLDQQDTGQKLCGQELLSVNLGNDLTMTSQCWSQHMPWLLKPSFLSGKCPMSNVQRPMSNVQCPMSNVQRPVSNVQRPVSIVQCHDHVKFDWLVEPVKFLNQSWLLEPVKLYNQSVLLELVSLFLKLMELVSFWSIMKQVGIDTSSSGQHVSGIIPAHGGHVIVTPSKIPVNHFQTKVPLKHVHTPVCKHRFKPKFKVCSGPTDKFVYIQGKGKIIQQRIKCFPVGTCLSDQATYLTVCKN